MEEHSIVLNDYVTSKVWPEKAKGICGGAVGDAVSTRLLGLGLCLRSQKYLRVKAAMHTLKHHDENYSKNRLCNTPKYYENHGVSAQVVAFDSIHFLSV